MEAEVGVELGGDDAQVLSINVADDVMSSLQREGIYRFAVVELHANLREQFGERISHTADGKALRAGAQWAKAALDSIPVSRRSHSVWFVKNVRIAVEERRFSAAYAIARINGLQPR